MLRLRHTGAHNQLRWASVALENASVWQAPDIVAQYAGFDHLQAPEQAILTLLTRRLTQSRMLDIGVGAGRTMLHFAPLVREYFGIDYSPAMIAASQARQPAKGAHVSLAVCDALAMTIFPDGFFDFVLFSFNGIDYVSHEDRLRIFSEVKRVSAPEGIFCFSTHNLQDLRHLAFKNQIADGWDQTLANLRRCAALRFRHNKILSLTRLRSSRYALLNDGVHGNRLRAYYIKPVEQLRQLVPFFRHVKVFRLEDGAVVRRSSDLAAIDDPWLYYLCAPT